MSPIPLRGRRDKTHTPIVKAIRGAGYLAHPSKDWDVTVCRLWPTRAVAMMEFKTGKGKLTASQQKLLDDGWPLLVANTPEQALTVLHEYFAGV